MIGTLKDLFKSRDGEWVLSFSTPVDPRELFDRLKDDQVDIELKKHRAKRSLDANAFAWVLIDKLAAEMNMKKTDVYLNAIADIGGITSCVAVKEEFAESYIAAWKADHLGRDAWIVPSREDKPGWVVIKVRLGSSDFDTLQMSRFLNMLIQDCESIGISTISDKDAERLIGSWAKKGGSENENDD